MNLCSLPEIKELLARHGFHFSKSKGQNFLTQSWVVEQIAASAGVARDCGVVEIGPGIGPLTEQLCLRAGKVLAIEVDETLRPVLAETMAPYDNLEILWGDAMKMDIAALVKERFDGLKPMACANLPYYITTPVLAALLEAGCFSSVTVMVQKEVAQRICAKAGTAEYGAFSVFCQFWAEPELLFDVPAHCFIPQPKVTSAVLQLKLREQPAYPVEDQALFFRTVRAAFAQRRKTLLNTLASGFSEFKKPELEQIIIDAGFSPTVRGETLDLEGFTRLANEIAKNKR